MQIGVISDTHIPEACQELWPQVCEAFRGVDLILHAGDVYDLRIVDELNETAPIYVARGNGDDGQGGRAVQPEDERLRETWSLELAGIRVGLTHTVYLPAFARTLDRLFPDGKPDVLIYGDTHVEAIDVIDGVLCLNPGSPTLPHNLNTQLGTIGFLEIDAGKPSASVWQLTEGGIEPFDWNR
jgi:putative phosphoesterase